MFKVPKCSLKFRTCYVYIKPNLFGFQVEQSSGCCTRDRMWVNESLYLFTFFWDVSSLSSGRMPSLRPASMSLNWFLRPCMPMISMVPRRKGRHSSFATILCFPLIVIGSIPYSWQLNRTVDGRGRSWWGPAELRKLYPISVCYSMENEDELYLDKPYCPNAYSASGWSSVEAA